MLLMRHESIETTLRFYVGRSAQRTAKTLWEAHKKAQSGNSGQIRSDWADTSNDATPSAPAAASGTVRVRGTIVHS